MCVFGSADNVTASKHELHARHLALVSNLQCNHLVSVAIFLAATSLMAQVLNNQQFHRPKAQTRCCQLLSGSLCLFRNTSTPAFPILAPSYPLRDIVLFCYLIQSRTIILVSYCFTFIKVLHTVDVRALRQSQH